MTPDRPRHFSPSGYVVLCGGLALRHHLGAFPSPEDAETWAETAHCCPGRHQVIRLDTLREMA